MIMTRMRPVAFALILLVSACAGLPGGPTRGRVDVQGPIATGQAAYALQGLANRVPYTLDRLAYIDVYARQAPGLAYASVARMLPHGTEAAGRTFDPIRLTNLLPRETYQVRLRAFQADPTQAGVVVEVTYGAANDDFADSTTSFDTNAATAGFTGGANELVQLPTGFRLRLADQVHAVAATGLLVAAGALRDQGHSTAIAFPAPGTAATSTQAAPGTPTEEPTATPTPEPAGTPTPEATATPTPEATATPTPEATATPTPEPTATPTPEPTATPTPEG